MYYDVKIINAEENPEEVEKLRVPDYVFDTEKHGKKSVTELVEEGVSGLRLLAPLMDDERNNAYERSLDMYNAVSQALSDHIVDVYVEISRRKKKDQLDFLGAIATIMEKVPFFGNFAYGTAVMCGYHNLYDAVISADREDIIFINEEIIMELDKVYVYGVRDDEPEPVPAA